MTILHIIANIMQIKSEVHFNDALSADYNLKINRKAKVL